MRIGEKVIYKGKEATIYDYLNDNRIWVETEEDIYITTINNIKNYTEVKTQEIIEVLEQEGYEASIIAEDNIGEVEFITIAIELIDYIVYIDINNNNTYDLCTFNKNREYEEEEEDIYKNKRSVKGIKTIIKYVEKYDK